MQTDKGDDGDAEKSDVVVAINNSCVHNLPLKGQFWNSTLEDGAVLYLLKKTVSESGWEVTSILTLKQRIKE